MLLECMMHEKEYIMSLGKDLECSQNRIIIQEIPFSLYICREQFCIKGNSFEARQGRVLLAIFHTEVFEAYPVYQT